MVQVKNNHRDLSVIGYFIITIAITWICIYGAIGLSGIFHLNEIPTTNPTMVIVYVSTLLGPLISGLLFNLISKRLKMNYSPLFKVIVHPKWYLFSLFTAFILINIILFSLSLIEPRFIPEIFKVESKFSLIIISIVMGVFVGLLEEIGWTGFAVPKLLERNSFLKVGIVVGFVWGIWHLPLFISLSNNIDNVLFKIGYICVLLFSFLIPYRILMVYLFKKTKSLFLVILMHAPLAASQMLLIPTKLSNSDVVIFDIIFGVLLWIIVIFIYKKKT